jgi:hypothetical protein
MLHTHAACLCLYAACPCRVSMLGVSRRASHAACPKLLVHSECPCCISMGMSLLHVVDVCQAADHHICQLYRSILPAKATCPWLHSMLHPWHVQGPCLHAACPCRMSMPHTHASCPCCMPMLYVRLSHAACPCSMSVSPCCMSMPSMPAYLG